MLVNFGSSQDFAIVNNSMNLAVRDDVLPVLLRAVETKVCRYMDRGLMDNFQSVLCAHREFFYFCHHAPAVYIYILYIA